MPLENILQALETEATRQVAEIEQATQAEIERIRDQAQAEAVAIRQKQMALIQAPLQAERARILNRARLEALQIVMGAREVLITSALEAAAQCLAALAGSTEYARLLGRLAQEAVEVLGGDDSLCLRVQSCDVELMGQIVQKMGLSATVEADWDSGGESGRSTPWGDLGGLVATTLDERIKLVNTLGTRLQRVADLHRSQIAELICAGAAEG